MILIKFIAVLKVLFFGLPFLFYKFVQHDSTNFSDFVDSHTEEVAGGSFAGLGALYEIVSVTVDDAHDLWIAFLKAILMAVTGYVVAYVIKKISLWIKKK